MNTVSPVKVVAMSEAAVAELSPRVQEALGDLVGAAKEGLLALSVGVGLGVLETVLGEEVDELCGPKGRHDPDRSAYRHGTEGGSVTLGGRRVAVNKPRVRSKDSGGEVPLTSYQHFAARDPLTAVVLERMLAYRHDGIGGCRNRSVLRSKRRRSQRPSRQCRECSSSGRSRR
jgi:hypothetical protein